MAFLNKVFSRQLLASLAFGLCLVVLPVDVGARVFSPEVYQLSNGLQIVIIKKNMASAVGHMVWYKVGAADEEDGKTGLAHYLEHMMFKGTPTFPSGSFHKMIAARGGYENAFTSHDATVYYQTLAQRDLGLAMWMEADRMQKLSLSPLDAAPEKDVVLSERQQRTDNDPNGIFREKLRAIMFPAHPYGRPVIGWKEDIEQLDVGDMRLFYTQHYKPSNAFVVVTGPVETQEVLRLATGLYGRLPPQKVVARKPLPLSEKPSQEVFVYKDSRVTQPYGLYRVVVPSLLQDTRKAYALDVLAEVLGGGEVGLLHRKFVVESEKASAVSVSYSGMTRGPATFTIAFSPRPDENVRELAAAIKKHVVALSVAGFTAQDVHKAKQRLQDSAVFARDSLMAPAHIVGGALSIGLPVQEVESWPERISRVSVAEVRQALQEIVASSYHLTAFLEPEVAP